MSRKLARLIVCLGSGLVTLVICAYLATALIRSEINSGERAIELVSARGLGAIALVIPKAYVYSLPNPDGKEQELIVLTAALPDMQPWRLAGQSENQRVYIEAWNRQRVVATEIIPREIIGEKTYQGTTDDGFQLYKLPPTPSKKPEIITQREYLIPVDFGPAQPTVFTCAPNVPDRPPDSIGCTADTDIGDNLHVRYNFRRAHLREWQDLDAKIRSLFNSFVPGSSGSGAESSG